MLRFFDPQTGRYLRRKQKMRGVLVKREPIAWRRRPSLRGPSECGRRSEPSRETLLSPAPLGALVLGTGLYYAAVSLLSTATKAPVPDVNGPPRRPCQSAAEARGRNFLPLGQKRYDFVIPDNLLYLPMVETFIETLRQPYPRRQIEALGGYDVSSVGVQRPVNSHAHIDVTVLVRFASSMRTEVFHIFRSKMFGAKWQLHYLRIPDW